MKRIIQKLIWHPEVEQQLVDSKYTEDRLGDIVTVEVDDIPNMEYAFNRGIQAIQNVIQLLSDTYDYTNPTMSHMLGKEGEQCECWIYRSMSKGTQFRVIHKYWNSKQVLLFKSLLMVMAEHYGWEWEVD